jgi:WD40 repeat protein
MGRFRVTIWLAGIAAALPALGTGQEPEKRQAVWKDALKGDRWKGLALSPDKKYLVTNADGDSLRIWDVATGQPLITKDDAEYTKWFLFSKDGKHLFADCKAFGPPGTGGHTKILEVPSGKEVGRYHAGMLLAAAPDGDHLLLTQNIDGKSCKVMLWDWRKGREVWSVKSEDRHVEFGTFSRDGKFAATSSTVTGAPVEVWDVAAGKRSQRMVLPDRTDPYGALVYLRTLAFSPDGKTLAGGGPGRRVEVLFWDLETGKAGWVYRYNRAHHVNDVYYTPDGRGLIQGGANGVGLLNLKTAKVVASFGEGVRRMVVSADGRLAVAIHEGSDDIRFYDIPELPKDE